MIQSLLINIGLKPFLKYPGGKTSELPLVRHFKPKFIERYFEPFVGGGAVYFDINVSNSFINDKSEDLYYLYLYIKELNHDFYKYINLINQTWKDPNNIDFNLLGVEQSIFNKYYKKSLNRKKILIKKLESSGKEISNNNKEELDITSKKTALYTALRDLYNSKDQPLFKRIAVFYFLREYCYSSMFRFNSRGDFNVPYGGMGYNEKFLDSKLEYMFSNQIRTYLEKTSISNIDFEQFFEKFDFNENDFIFLDPPYDSEFSSYDNNNFSKDDQIRLRNNLINLKSKWMLIIKKTDFIHNLYKQFYIYEYDKTYTVSFKNRNRKEAKHLLITNYIP